MAIPYEHDPLRSADSIRLVDLIPSTQRNTPVRCKIRQIKLRKARSTYEALSYVWGDREGSRPILCSGRELLVTPNCHDALVQLRRQYRNRTLWVDAICIDQTPAREPERNHQVKTMGQIYENASTVLIWLGPGGIRLTLRDHIRLLGPIFAKLLVYVPLILCCRDSSWIPFHEISDAAARKEYGTLLQKIADHPWFSRVWTVQEFAFARKRLIVSGSSQIRWAPLDPIRWWLAHGTEFAHMANNQIRFRSDARTLVHFKGEFTDYSKPEWNGDRFWYLKATKNRNWHDWEEKRLRFIRSIKDLDSKLPHDKIYGVYSILQKMGIRVPDPDYSQPIEKVVKDFTRALIAGTRSLDLITLDLPQTGYLGTESWVPEFFTRLSQENQEPGESILQSIFHLQRPYASNWTKAHVSLETAANKLLVRGKRVANLKTTMACDSELDGGSSRDWGQYRDFIQLCRQWCHFCSALPNNADALKHSIGKNFLAENFVYDHFIPPWQDLMLYPSCRKIEPETVAQYSEPTETDPVTILINYLTLAGPQKYLDSTASTARDIQAEFNRTAKWAFVVTSNGLTGRAYRTCQDNDELWLLAGSSAPVVLRPTGHEGDFRYISPAYFHGLMEGEFWPKDGEEVLEMISLV
ncbi:heterokaryon incompatibility protein-domain-containing protein [Apiospora aurea]|uniref:Heterokaryon incompatibility protein-domain-containing protein n=1 Tax=Apiospora aurea TaxID=335848 RepID=A0ABR1PTH6_9PEZI